MDGYGFDEVKERSEMAFAEGRGVVLSVAQSLRVEHHGPQSTQRAQHLLFEPRCGCHAHPARARAERMAAHPHRDDWAGSAGWFVAIVRLEHN
jgi:hypothetical protein